jgi:signal transduction histidine kinase
LTIRTREAGSDVFLDVEDTGIGMTRDVREKIFLPFFTTKDVDEGTGLGLAVVHGIVTAHGGAITAESEPGEGTRFSVRLPLSTAKSPEEAAEHGARG